MKTAATWILIIFVTTGASAQIIKPRAPKLRTRLDSLYTSEHFRFETLDSVYRYFSQQYRITIHYDTAYARRHSMNYWYMNTALSRALEITTYGQRLSFNIDSNALVTILRREKTPEDDTLIEKPVEQHHYTGAPVRHNFQLNGKVVDFNSGLAVSNASIVRNANNESVSVDSNGYFSLPDISSDTASLTVKAFGYQQLTVFLSPRDQTDNYAIELMPDERTMMKGVLVRAARADVSLQSVENISVLMLTPAKLAELPNVGEKDVMRSMQLMPGVSAAHESSSGLYVRGGTPDQNLVLYDGFTVYHVDHLYGFFSAFNSNALKDMKLYKGGFDAKWGGRLSSVSDLTGKEGDRKKFNLGGDISLLSGNIFTEIPLSEKITITAAGRRSWKGPIYNWIFDKFGGSDADVTSNDGRGTQTKTTSYFSDINTKIAYHPSANDNLAFNFFTSKDYLENTQTVTLRGPFGGGGFGANNAVDKTKYANRGLSLQHNRNWSKHINSLTTVAYSNYFSERNRTNGRTTIDTATDESTTVNSGVIEKNDLRDFSLRSDFDWNTGRHHQFSFGAFATFFDIRYSYAEDDTSTILDRKNKGNVAGGYIQDRLRFWRNKIELKGGLRATYFDVTARTYIEPRLATSYKISERLSFKAAYGDYYQFANQVTREDILNGNKEFWVLSDGKNVPVSKATHYIAGLSWENRDYLFSAEGYYKELSDITQYSLRFSSLRSNRSYDEDFYVGKGTARGIELMAQKKTGNLTGWISYAFGKAQSQFDVYGADYFPANQDVTNELKAVAIYKLKKWDISATWIFATGRPYTAPGGSYSVTLLDGTTKEYFTVTSQNSLRLPDYHRLDLAVNRHFYNERGGEVGYIGLSIFNAYNRTNVWYKQYYVSEGTITETSVNYLGITPNLTLSLKLH